MSFRQVSNEEADKTPQQVAGQARPQVVATLLVPSDAAPLKIDTKPFLVPRDVMAKRLNSLNEREIIMVLAAALSRTMMSIPYHEHVKGKPLDIEFTKSTSLISGLIGIHGLDWSKNKLVPSLTDFLFRAEAIKP